LRFQKIKLNRFIELSKGEFKKAIQTSMLVFCIKGGGNIKMSNRQLFFEVYRQYHPIQLNGSSMIVNQDIYGSWDDVLVVKNQKNQFAFLFRQKKQIGFDNELLPNVVIL